MLPKDAYLQASDVKSVVLPTLDYLKGVNAILNKDINSLLAFSTCLARCIDTIEEPYIDSAIHALVLLINSNRNIPEPELYINFAEKLYRRNENIADQVELLQTLYNSKQFVIHSLKHGKTAYMLRTILNKAHQSTFLQFSGAIRSKQLAEVLSLPESYHYLLEILTIIFQSNCDIEVLLETIIFILNVVYSAWIACNTTIQNLLDSPFFSLFNSFLSKCPSQSVYQLYHILLICTKDYCNADVFKRLCEFYRSQPRYRRAIIVGLYEDDSLYKSKILTSLDFFSVDQWIFDTLTNDSVAFPLFLSIVLSSDPSIQNKTSEILLKMCTPLIKPDFQYESFFSFLKQAFNNISSKQNILTILFENPEASIITELIEKYPSTSFIYEVLFVYFPILDKHLEKMVQHHSEKSLLLFSKICADNISSTIVRFFIRNIDKEVHVMFWDYITSDEDIDFVSLFESSYCFSLVEKFTTIPQGLIDFIVKIERRTHNHFFDDWVIKQPADSPIFSVEFHSDVHPLPLPSLQEFCPSNLHYDRFLQGFYTLPVYHKLGKKIGGPDFKEAVNTMIRQEDFEKLDWPTIAANLTCDHSPFSFWEFLPDKPGWLTGSSTFTVLLNSPKKTTVASFNGISIIAENGTLSLSNGFKLCTFQKNQWHKINFSATRIFNNQVDFFFDDVLLHTIGLKEEFSFEYIGSKSAPSHFLVKADFQGNAYGGCLCVIKNPLQLSIIQNLPRVMQQFDQAAIEEQHIIVIGLLMLMDYVTKEQANSIFAQFLYILIKNYNQQTIKYLQMALASIFSVHNIEIRTDLICQLLTNIDMFNKLSPEEACELINPIALSKEQLDFDQLISQAKIFVPICMLAINYYNNERVTSLYFKFFENIMTDALKIETLDAFAKMTQVQNIWTFEKENFLTKVVRYEQTSKLQEALLSLVLKIEKNRSVKLINNRALLNFAFIIEDEELAFRCFKKVIEMTDEAFLVDAMPVIAAISRRFVNQKDLWDFVIHFKSLSKKGLKTLFLPILFTLLSLQPKNQQASKVLIEFSSSFNQPYVFPYFVNFICKGKREWPSASVQQLEDVENQDAAYQQFLDFLHSKIENQFKGDDVLSTTVALNYLLNNPLDKALEVLLSFASDKLVIDTLSHYLRETKINEKIVKIVAKSLQGVISTRELLITDERLFDNFVNLSSQKRQYFAALLDFFIPALDHLNETQFFMVQCIIPQLIGTSALKSTETIAQILDSFEKRHIPHDNEIFRKLVDAEKELSRTMIDTFDPLSSFYRSLNSEIDFSAIQETKKWKAMEMLPMPVNDLATIEVNLFLSATSNAILAMKMFTLFSRKICVIQNQNEQTAFRFIFDKLKLSQPVSYRLSPFAYPITCKSVLYEVPLKPDEVVELPKRAEHVLGISPVHDELQHYFNAIFGKYDGQNCTLVRLNLKIPSIYFKTKTGFLVLTAAKLDPLELIDSPNSLNKAFLLGEFGPIETFEGHFVIRVEQEQIIHFRALPLGCEFFTDHAGSFILNGIEAPKPNNLQFDKENIISNYDLLLQLNYFADRTFNDLSFYPVFPRLVSTFEPLTLRDLSQNISAFSDNDPTHNVLIGRLKVQKFHHPENVLNPLFITSLMERVAPFCEYQWEVNNGWDAGDRHFTDVDTQLVVMKNSNYELIPEFFSFPAAFINKNHFILPSGASLDVRTPKPMAALIKEHRNILESVDISGWVDLIFGCKVNDVESINTYHPLSYINNQKLTDPQQLAWIIECGAVPKSLFKTPFSFEKKVLPQPIEFVKQNTIERSQRRYSVFNLKYGETTVYSGKQQLSSCFLSASQRSSVLEYAMVCATCCTNEVVIWCLSNGRIICRLPITGAVASFDSVQKTIWIASKKNLQQYCLNGELIEEAEFREEITAIDAHAGYLALGSCSGMITVLNMHKGVVMEEKVSDFIIKELKIDGSKVLYRTCL